jgi:7-cyano-7-deazaguanine reductase
MTTLVDSEDLSLGKKTSYPREYSPNSLFPIPRENNRSTLNLGKQLPFTGVDIWNAYEFSWLNEKGKPNVAIIEFIFPCESSHIIESKSFKLYLNSFHQTKFSSTDDIIQLLQKDLSAAVRAPVGINFFPPANWSSSQFQLGSFSGLCLDSLDVSIQDYHINANLLTHENSVVEEKLYSNLLKANCLITQQPDWASVYISYRGRKINHENLLKYIISFRDHNEFAEPCAERIFTDLMNQCQPEKLTVYTRFTRRGGLDINPFRTNNDETYLNIRDFRQ